MTETPRIDWHALNPDDVCQQLQTHTDGLTENEVSRRQSWYGPNRLPRPSPKSPWRRFAHQFRNLLIQVLVIAAVVTALLGHWIDTGVIAAVVLLNAIIGFIQEGRAEQALDAIRAMLAPRATAIRKGERRSLAAEELVPGDLVVLEPGDKIPADLRLVSARGLTVQEAALTGESVPVEKTTATLPPATPLADRTCMAFTGTLVASGFATGYVIATGKTTELGRISDMVQGETASETPLLHQMSIFAQRLTFTILGLAALLLLYGVLGRGIALTDMFITAVGLSVAAIPEGLPAILTVTLAIGIQRMARRSSIIRRLPAVETLGAVSIICSDKTGTLTRNEMTVTTLITPSATYRSQGLGYDPGGTFQRDDSTQSSADLSDLCGERTLTTLLRTACLCNDAHLRQSDGLWMIEGDPMEAALLVAGLKGQFDGEEERRRIPRTDVIPFDASHRFMATLHHDHESHAFIAVKGAPEAVIAMCDRDVRDDDSVGAGESGCDSGGQAPCRHDIWMDRVDALASEGLRVLAFAIKEVPVTQQELEFADMKDFAFLGLTGLIDPPRDEAIAAVSECQAAGIGIKMITGDHAATAVAIARMLGLARTDRALTGTQLDDLGDHDLAREVAAVDVFARTSPEHKLRLVSALQTAGHIVAMTGDGVNDAPALKRADVGIAMGQSGTEAAKEAAEMVVADDNFASIAAAVREGRTVYTNLKKAIAFLLPVNGGESLGIVTALLIGTTLPITALQILWVNMVSSVALAMALAFEPTERTTMHRPPRRPDDVLLSRFLLWRIVLVSVLFVGGIFTIFHWSLAHHGDLAEARTAAVNTLVTMEIFYLFSVRFLGEASLSWHGIKGTPAVLIAIGAVICLQLIFTYTPLMQGLFDNRPLSIFYAMPIFAVGLVLFIVLEIEKWIRLALFAKEHAS